MDEHDAIIIGAGQGGIPLAANLADAGWSVALIERAHLGGSCINYGCTPTKAMVASARRAWVARNSAELGVRTEGVEVDLAAIVERKDGIVRSFREGLQRRVDREGLDLVRGDARFAGPGTVTVGDRELRSDRIVIDVGARPVVPPIEGIDAVPWVDSTGIMELREVPEHLLVVGGGYVGCEFVQMFRRFGSEVTVLQAAPRLLPAEDEEFGDAVRERFEEEGVRVIAGARVTAARGDEGDLEVDVRVDGGAASETEAVHGSHLLLAAGRRPATEGLGLEAIGLETDERGAIPVDEGLHTGVEGVWAIGDVNGNAPFTNVSYHDFQVLFESWTNGKEVSTAERHHVSAVYVDPPVARVGLNEREAKERDVEYEVASTPMSHVARAIEMGETAGLMKVLADPASRKILGAAMMGVSADEVIHIFAAVMDAGATYEAIERGVYAHPAVAEALPVLVRKLEGGYA